MCCHIFAFIQTGCFSPCPFARNACCLRGTHAAYVEQWNTCCCRGKIPRRMRVKKSAKLGRIHQTLKNIPLRTRVKKSATFCGTLLFFGIKLYN